MVSFLCADAAGATSATWYVDDEGGGTTNATAVPGGFPIVGGSANGSSHESGVGMSNNAGSGPGFDNPFFIAVEAGGDLVVADPGLVAVVRVDPVTGDRTIVSDAGNGAGPAYASPVGIAIEASGDYLVGDTLPRENVNTNRT